VCHSRRVRRSSSRLTPARVRVASPRASANVPERVTSASAEPTGPSTWSNARRHSGLLAMRAAYPPGRSFTRCKPGANVARMDTLDDRRPPAEETFMEARRTAGPGEDMAQAASTIEPPSVPDGTFVKVAQGDHRCAAPCEVAVYVQDYHRSSSKLGRFGKIVGIDVEDGEYLVMLDNFECLAVPMRRVEWRKVAT
jgi:hypothetical protein